MKTKKARTGTGCLQSKCCHFDAYQFEDKSVVPLRARPKLVLVLVLVLGSKGLYCCKYKLPKISRLFIHVDLHTIELSRTFYQVTYLLRNTTKIVLT